MDILQHINDSDTIFSLVSKKLSKSKIHELLTILQSFISNLQEKDLDEDSFKEMIIKRDPRTGGNQVYLNYSLQPSTPARLSSDIQSPSTKQIHSDFSLCRNSELVCDSSIPIKKIKPGTFTEPFAGRSPYTNKKKSPLPSGFYFGTDVGYAPDSRYNNEEKIMDIPRDFKKQRDLRNRQEETDLIMKPDFSRFNPFDDNLQYRDAAQIIQHNIIEIEDFSVNGNPNQRNSDSECYSQDYRPQDIQHYRTPHHQSGHRKEKNSLMHKKFRNFKKFRYATRVYNNYEEEPEQRSSYMTYRKHRQPNNKYYDKRSSSASLRQFSSSSLNFFDGKENPADPTQLVTQDCQEDDDPIHLNDPKEDNFVYGYLRKPYSYLKAIGGSEENTSADGPSYIEID